MSKKIIFSCSFDMWDSMVMWVCSLKFYNWNAWIEKCLHSTYQITFIVTSPQHKCLGEWNSYERASERAFFAKKINQFTYRQYIFTDCTEDNVQNTHTYTQYTQCTIKTYLVTNTPIHIIHRMYTSALCTHLYIVICEGATDYKFTTD